MRGQTRAPMKDEWEATQASPLKEVIKAKEAGKAITRMSLAPGMTLTLGLAVLAWWVGTYFLPLVGGPVIGILLGVAVNNLVSLPKSLRPGIAFSSKKILQTSIVFLGAGLSLHQVWRTGLASLSVMALTISSAFIVAFLFGRVLKVSTNLTSLIGVGTAICGASAIAAVAPIVEADDHEVAYSISTIFFFNLLAVLIFPALGHLLRLSQAGFGLWAGTAINDTSSVVAAGYAFGQAAGNYATIVKLTRTTMIIPIALIFSIAGSRRREGRLGTGTAGFKLSRLIPWFVVWFLVASFLNTVGLFTAPLSNGLNVTGRFLIVVALVAVGLGADLKKIMATGFRPLGLGMIVWFIVAAGSLLVQRWGGQF